MTEHRLRLIISNIRRKREELEYSQEYMAMKMAIKQNCYSKLELGKSKLTVERMYKICELLDINPVELVK